MFKAVYQDELEVLDALARRFARLHPDVAGELGLGGYSPETQRLFQGTALLFARLREGFEAPYQELLEPVLQRAGSPFAQPMPCSTIVSFQPQAGILRKPCRIPLHAPIYTEGEDGEVCTFRTSCALQVLPLVCDGWEFATPSPTQAQLKGEFRVFAAATTKTTRGGTAAASAGPGPSGKGLPPGQVQSAENTTSMPLYVAGPPAQQFPLFVALCKKLRGIEIFARYGPGGEASMTRRLPASTLRPWKWHPDEALFPVGTGPCAPPPVLLESLILPQRFLFVTLTGLEWLFQLNQLARFSVQFELEAPRLAELNQGRHGLSRHCLVPHCVPAVNLRAVRAEQLVTKPGRSFYRLHPPRPVQDLPPPPQEGQGDVDAAPPAAIHSPHELYDIVGVSGLRRKAGRRTYLPHLATEAIRHHFDSTAIYYRVTRKSAVASPESPERAGSERRTRSVETYLELLGADGSPAPSGLTVDVDLLVSDGARPEGLRLEQLCRPSSEIPSSVRFQAIEPFTRYGSALPLSLESWREVRARRRDLSRLSSKEELRLLLRRYHPVAAGHAEVSRALESLLAAISSVRVTTVTHVLGVPPAPLTGLAWRLELDGARVEPIERLYPIGEGLFGYLCAIADQNMCVRLNMIDLSSREEWVWGPETGQMGLT